METQEIIELTKQLIAIPSTADNPQALREAVDLVAAVVARHADITIERFERNGKHSFLAYKSGQRPAKFDVLLNGHLDVVPGKPELFKPREESGRLYGRGALDMKGTAFALTRVFCELVNEVPYNLGLQIVSDEEIGGYDGARMHLDDYGLRADFVIIGEYSNHPGTIYNAARGVCWTEIAFSGKVAHGGHPWHGSNAVVKAADFAAAVLKRYPTPDKEAWVTTANIASLSTPNETFNKVPDNAVLKIDFRFADDPMFASRESVEAFIASIDPTAELIGMSVFEPAVNVSERNSYVQGLSRAVERVTHQKAEFGTRPAGSDGRHFALAGVDCIEFGLRGQNQHSDDEYVETSSFQEYHDILSAFLRQPISSHPTSVFTAPEKPELAATLSKTTEV